MFGALVSSAVEMWVSIYLEAIAFRSLFLLRTSSPLMAPLFINLGFSLSTRSIEHSSDDLEMYMNTNNGKTVIVVAAGIIVILIGLAMLLGNIFGSGLFTFWRYLTIVLSVLCSIIIIALGVILLVYSGQKSQAFVAEKRLYRSTSGKSIGGVCAGVANYFKVDPVIIRIITVVLGLTSAYLIVPLYLILWAIVPPDTRKTGTWE